jgi:hypothetical protein
MSAVVRLDSPRPLREALATAGALARLADWRLLAPPWPGFPAPFAGQWARRAALDAIVAGFAPDVIMETGTFLGVTTRALTRWGVPVYSAEIQPQWLHLARLATSRAPGVTLIGGDSVAGLAWVREHVRPQRPLAYLDAHWQSRLPLAEEVALVMTGWDEAVIVVDDCRVPHDAGYGYDSYDGAAIEEELLQLPADALVAYPAVPAAREAGARRGTLYAGRGVRATRALEAAIAAGHLR